jgi:UPF0716 protein FxsA
MTGRRRSRLFWVVAALLVVVPIVEIWVLIQVGHVIGVWWTVLLLLADSAFGAWLVKREGGRTFGALREAIGSGRVPARELADGGLVLVGGTLMLAPGFVTDLFGIAMILPFTRPAFRGLLTRAVAERMVPFGATAFGPGATTPGNATRPGAGPEGPVVRGEVVDEP